MLESKPVVSPMELSHSLSLVLEEDSVNGTLLKQIIGALTYLTNTKPDISYLVGVLR